MKNNFIIKDVITILAIPRERFKEWVFRGYIKPSLQKAEGTGTKNIYSRFDLYAIKLFDLLLNIYDYIYFYIRDRKIYNPIIYIIYG